jgi:hypothetical protein
LFLRQALIVFKDFWVYFFVVGHGLLKKIS